MAHGDAHRIEAAEERVARCMRRLLKATLALHRVQADCAAEEGRRRVVEGAVRLAVKV